MKKTYITVFLVCLIVIFAFVGCSALPARETVPQSVAPLETTIATEPQTVAPLETTIVTETVPPTEPVIAIPEELAQQLET